MRRSLEGKRFGREICGNPGEASGREWLETNGLGGYASSTIAGMNTRRYHGLLIAAMNPPVQRYVLLSKLEETILLNGERFDLSTNRYPGTVHPEGYRFLKEFRLDPFPVFVYEFGGAELRKTVFMVDGENTTVILYEMEASGDVVLELRPLIAFRDFHSTTHENEALNKAFQADKNRVRLRPYEDLPPLYLAHSGAEIQPAGYWYRNFEYEKERERGLDFHEDLFNPCVLKFELIGDGLVSIVASTEQKDAGLVELIRDRELQRRQSVFSNAPSPDGFARALTAAAGQFMVRRGEGHSVIAGYHWFSDWGRDTMIALPGLTLATRRFDLAKSILLAFAKYVDRGMIPNRFPDAGEAPEYNTVDATLWYFEAVRALVEAGGDFEWVRMNLYDILVEILDWHLHGTRYGIHVEPDGLLAAGEPGVQLTWMDAKTGDHVVTPRTGKPVEIQALWYNALRIMEQFSQRFGHEPGAKHYREIADTACKTFNPLFWNENEDCLYDVINRDGADASIRPNQIFAVSLHHSMLLAEKAVRAMAVVERELLTPAGLRTLSPRDPQYCGRYEGDVQSRDRAYHQGTVWAWLMGPFLTAYLKVHGNSGGSRARARELLLSFEPHLNEAGLGQVSEIFDGDPPHTPRGCIAQAWSVAELLRLTSILSTDKH